VLLLVTSFDNVGCSTGFCGSLLTSGTNLTTSPLDCFLSLLFVRLSSVDLLNGFKVFGFNSELLLVVEELKLNSDGFKMLLPSLLLSIANGFAPVDLNGFDELHTRSSSLLTSLCKELSRKNSLNEY